MALGRIAAAGPDTGVIKTSMKSKYAYIFIATVFVLLACTKLLAASYEFNGDTLGMSFSDFERKHKRALKNGIKEIFPDCTGRYKGKWEGYATVNGLVPDLLEERWHDNAGIETCQINWPYELTQGDYQIRIGNDSLHSTPVYYFIDQRLYRIFLVLNKKEYVTVRRSLVSQYGPAGNSGIGEGLKRFGYKGSGKYDIWENGSSQIILQDLDGSEYSALLYVHKELEAVAETRRPK